MRETAISGYFKLGGALTDKVLLGAESQEWTGTKRERGVSLSYGSLSVVAYIYPVSASDFFLKGGLGYSTVNVHAGPSGEKDEIRAALTLGAGFDIGFGGRFALTPYASFVYSSLDDLGTSTFFHGGLGVNWY